jgi:hypothetical protein
MALCDRLCLDRYIENPGRSSFSLVVGNGSNVVEPEISIQAFGSYYEQQIVDRNTIAAKL